MSTPIPGIAEGTTVRRLADGTHRTDRDAISVEAPLEIRLGDAQVAVTMRTPGHDRELVAGFLACEGILTSPDQIREITARTTTSGSILRVELVADGRDIAADLAPLTRYGTISSSCGVCGKTTLEALRTRLPSVLEDTTAITPEILLRLPSLLRENQSAFALTGGVHAAGLFDTEGNPLGLFEDVGRHNAVDKVLGAAFLAGQWPLRGKVLVVSGRTSFEIVQKSLAAGVCLLAAVSAPSTLAVDLARVQGQTLVAFLRPPTFNIYSHPQRVLLS